MVTFKMQFPSLDLTIIRRDPADQQITSVKCRTPARHSMPRPFHLRVLNSNYRPSTTISRLTSSQTINRPPIRIQHSFAVSHRLSILFRYPFPTSHTHNLHNGKPYLPFRNRVPCPSTPILLFKLVLAMSSC